MGVLAFLAIPAQSGISTHQVVPGWLRWRISPVLVQTHKLGPPLHMRALSWTKGRITSVTACVRVSAFAPMCTTTLISCIIELP